MCLAVFHWSIFFFRQMLSSFRILSVPSRGVLWRQVRRTYNKLKKTNPQAFFYYFQSLEVLGIGADG